MSSNSGFLKSQRCEGTRWADGSILMGARAPTLARTPQSHRHWLCSAPEGVPFTVSSPGTRKGPPQH